MKFLLDENVDSRLLPHLQSLGHDVTSIPKNYPVSLPDEDVLSIARSEGRVVPLSQE
jgi:predicted nuclease of predicted toxin-antitoxin system